MGKKHKLFEKFEWPEPEDDYEADRSDFSDPFSNFDSFINACDQSKSQASDEEETDVESIPFARTYLWKEDDSDDEDTASASEEPSAASESRYDLPFMIERFENTGSDAEEPDEEDRVSFASCVSARLFDDAKDEVEDESESDPEFTEQIASIKQQITGIVPIKPVVAATVKNENAKRHTLQDMQVALQLAVPIIYHNGGLYYYNGRTYSAIGSSPDLLAIIRQKVSHSGFFCASTKQFAELFNYMLADKERLTPVRYEERLTQSKYMVVLKNGVLDMESMRLISHSPRYLTFHELDAEWIDDEPEIFNRFLEEISGGNKQIQRRIKEATGCLLAGHNHSKAFFIMGISGNSGKSTLGRLLHRLLGDDKVCSISTYQLSERFALGGTRNKVLCLAMDIPNGYLNRTAVSIIKSISGGDSIAIEQKYEHPQYIVSGMRFLFGSNYPLTIPREFDEDAFWDRMIILPFLFSIPRDQADMNLLEKMLDEKDAIVSACLRAYRRVIKNNCQFSACDAADEMKAEWRGSQADSFSFQSFWQGQIEVTGNAENELYAGDLYDAYVRYCQQNNQTPISHTNMKAWIRQNIDPRLCYEKRLHKTNTNPRAGYVGIHLSTQE